MEREGKGGEVLACGGVQGQPDWAWPLAYISISNRPVKPGHPMYYSEADIDQIVCISNLYGIKYLICIFYGFEKMLHTWVFHRDIKYLKIVEVQGELTRFLYVCECVCV